jgi:hypothetical protein
MRAIGVFGGGPRPSMAALALLMRALEEREGPLAPQMRPFAPQMSAFARHIGAFARHIGAFARHIGAFAPHIGTFARHIGAFALFMSAHERRERSTNRPVRGGVNCTKPPVRPVRPDRGPRMTEPTSRAPGVTSVDSFLSGMPEPVPGCSAPVPDPLEGARWTGPVRRFPAFAANCLYLPCTARVRVVS